MYTRPAPIPNTTDIHYPYVSQDFPPRDADISVPFGLMSVAGSIDVSPPPICEIYHAISVWRITATYEQQRTESYVVGFPLQLVEMMPC